MMGERVEQLSNFFHRKNTELIIKSLIFIKDDDVVY